MQRKTKPPALHQLLDMESLDQDNLNALFKHADYFLGCIEKNTLLDSAQGQTIVNLFFEPSTRTAHSFEIAAKRLGATVINPNMKQLSVLKGESLVDTVRTFEAMGTSLFIIRHADNFTPQFIASELLQSTPVINAGDGTHQHPTQALLDLFTIQQLKKDFRNLTVAIIGDIAHSRVARSLVIGLRTLNTGKIHLIAPKTFQPEDVKAWHPAELFDNPEEGLKNADVIMTLRIQKERLAPPAVIPSAAEYFQEYGLTKEKLAFAKRDAIVMHPGPINRGIEIESSVADGKQSAILQQVRNGVAMRMAVLDAIFSAK